MISLVALFVACFLGAVGGSWCAGRFIRRGCACQEIQRRDPERHFKGCPLRKDLAPEKQAAINHSDYIIDQGILVACEALRMDATGSATLHEEARKTLVTWLSSKLARWVESTSPYDATVKALITAALAEHERRR